MISRLCVPPWTSSDAHPYRVIRNKRSSSDAGSPRPSVLELLSSSCFRRWRPPQSAAGRSLPKCAIGSPVLVPSSGICHSRSPQSRHPQIALPVRQPGGEASRVRQTTFGLVMPRALPEPSTSGHP